jgi:hypothetical protein
MSRRIWTGAPKNPTNLPVYADYYNLQINVSYLDYYEFFTKHDQSILIITPEFIKQNKNGNER